MEILLAGSCGVFQGISGKGSVLWWFFDGEHVVDCVANVVFWQSLFRGEKIRQVFRIYFLQVLFLEGCYLGHASAQYDAVMRKPTVAMAHPIPAVPPQMMRAARPEIPLHRA